MKTNLLVKKIISGLSLAAVLSITGCTITDITSSTSGTLDTVTPDVTLNKFVDIRLATIQKEAAQGQGENLDALASLLGKSDKSAFSTWMHKNYDELFLDLEEPHQLISRIENRASDLI